ncbi:PREDICTED: phospholipase A2-like [Ceratosolen solmsi marchali]|uniref:Phospholipase A2 n=1 Tax=Ceratosolen solmsi marchali TaxID=326594 RepID=A0AAJ6YR19_9HYME|nr:PREDICTED: phospholipase A2-like [Ceratosolen solmsi marchali]
MDKCDKLDENVVRSLNFNAYVEKYNEGNPLFDGIVPGTKWCGTGDIAKSYHDLGSRARVDRCCRAHDLCPIKIRAYKSRYNLMNNSFFSKSHCSCDKAFYDCLKNINHISARVIGNIYFNIGQPVCIEDVFSSKNKYLRRFVPVKTRF